MEKFDEVTAMLAQALDPIVSEGLATYGDGSSGVWDIPLLAFEFTSTAAFCTVRTSELAASASLETVVDAFLAGSVDQPDVQLVTGPEVTSLPAGEATMVVATLIDPQSQVATTTAVYILEGDTVAIFSCASPEPPDDDWLSIAETFEFLPAEE
jgi:hypothetical protein